MHPEHGLEYFFLELIFIISSVFYTGVPDLRHFGRNSHKLKEYIWKPNIIKAFYALFMPLQSARVCIRKNAWSKEFQFKNRFKISLNQGLQIQLIKLRIKKGSNPFLHAAKCLQLPTKSIGNILVSPLVYIGLSIASVAWLNIFRFLISRMKHSFIGSQTQLSLSYASFAATFILIKRPQLLTLRSRKIIGNTGKSPLSLQKNMLYFVKNRTYKNVAHLQ